MKKILTLVALVIGLVTSGQVKQTYPQYGGKWKRHQVDSAIKIPMLSVGVRDLNAGLDTAQLMYQKTDSSLRVYTGSQWLTIGGSSGSVTSISQGYGILNSPNPIIATGSVTLDSATIRAWLNGHYWNKFGDASTTPGTNFLGTTDAVDFVIKTGVAGNQVMRFSGDGLSRIRMGASTVATGDYSTAMGGATTASGEGSTAMGLQTDATGYVSTALGFNTTASGDISIAWGDNTIASGITSTAFGATTIASGGRAIAMGEATTASGGISTAMGDEAVASGDVSTTMGRGTKSKSYTGVAIGSFNDSTNAADPNVFNFLNRAFEIGIGQSDAGRLNAVTVLFNGRVGIGKLVPTEILDVVGNVRFSGALMPNNTAGTSGQVLTSAGAGVVPTWTTPSAGVNIYNTDGTLTGDRTVTGAGFNLVFDNVDQFLINATGGATMTNSVGSKVIDVIAGNVAASMIANDGGASGQQSEIIVYPDTIQFKPHLGRLYTDTLNYTLSTTRKKIMLRDTVTGLVENIDPALIGGGSGITVGTTTITSGTTTRIPFNDAGIYNEDAGLTYNKTTNILTVGDGAAGGYYAKATDGSGHLLIMDHLGTVGRIVSINAAFDTYKDLSISANNLYIYGGGVNVGIGINASGLVGIGSVSVNATAKLHIAAGTASASTAPLKFTTGTLNTTGEAGTVEYNGTHYLTKASGLRYATEGTIADFYTDVANSGTSETDLYTYTTPANTLANNGEKVFFTYTINVSDVTATAQVQVYFAGTVIANTSALTVSATGALIVNGWIVRTGASTARASVNIASPTASTAVYTAQTDLTGEDWTTTNILKCTGTSGGAGGGSSDITAKSGTVSWRGVAAN